MTGVHSSSSADERAQQAGLALPALAEQHDVVAREQRPLDLRDDGVGEAVEARPRVHPVAQPLEQVVADLLAQRLELVAALAELAEGARAGCRRPAGSLQSRSPR